MTKLTDCRLLAATCGLVLVTLSAPALAKPSHHRHTAKHHLSRVDDSQHVRHHASGQSRHVRRASKNHRYASHRSHRYASYRHHRSRIVRLEPTFAGSEERRGSRRAARRQEIVRTDYGQGSGGGAGFGGGSNVVAEARRWLGTNPTGRSSLWCARFMNFVLERTGHHGTGSDMASSFASAGQRVSGPQVGAIAVMSRGRKGGHVGVVSGINADGNPIIISGNHGHRVAEAVYSRSRIYAYVVPTS
jgi:uncharacterized protein (TIGR02594 family)